MGTKEWIILAWGAMFAVLLAFGCKALHQIKTCVIMLTYTKLSDSEEFIAFKKQMEEEDDEL